MYDHRHDACADCRLQHIGAEFFRDKPAAGSLKRNRQSRCINRGRNRGGQAQTRQAHRPDEKFTAENIDGDGESFPRQGESFHPACIVDSAQNILQSITHHTERRKKHGPRRERRV